MYLWSTLLVVVRVPDSLCLVFPAPGTFCVLYTYILSMIIGTPFCESAVVVRPQATLALSYILCLWDFRSPVYLWTKIYFYMQFLSVGVMVVGSDLHYLIFPAHRGSYISLPIIPISG